MDAVGPYFPIDMTQDCLILLSLSKKRPKNNLKRRVACSRRGSSMQIRKTQFFLRHPVSFCTHSLFRSHSHLPVPLWSQSFLIINPTQPTCTAGLLPDRAEVVRETFCKITSASTKVAIIPSISSSFFFWETYDKREKNLTQSSLSVLPSLTSITSVLLTALT